MKRQLVVLAGVLLYIHISFYALAQVEKYALVIGVKSYINVPPLRNSLNDAQDVAAVLNKKGFNVTVLYEPKTKREMQETIKKYFSLIHGKPDASSLVFYSGHGIQVNGINYLIPTQAYPEIEADLDDQCLRMDYILSAIEQAGINLNIFILDACRNNPFRSFNRSGEKGLGTVDTPKGSYIVYATKPGSVASDGLGRNSLFTSKFLRYIDIEGLNIEQVFKQVARDVVTASGDTQRPWIASDYTGDFYFTPFKTKTSTLEYKLVDGIATAIGNQKWLIKNLNTSHFANGDPIPEASTIDEWILAGENEQPAWCYFNNDSSTSTTYGRLYNWYAVNDSRGLAPLGWSIPSNNDWDGLIKQMIVKSNMYNKPEYSSDFLLGNYTSYVTDVVGSMLKSIEGWDNDGNGTDEIGFSALPNGMRTTFRTFLNLGKGSDWWSSSENDKGTAWCYSLSAYNSNIEKTINFKAFGFSVRAIKN